MSCFCRQEMRLSLPLRLKMKGNLVRFICTNHLEFFFLKNTFVLDCCEKVSLSSVLQSVQAGDPWTGADPLVDLG